MIRGHAVSFCNWLEARIVDKGNKGQSRSWPVRVWGGGVEGLTRLLAVGVVLLGGVPALLGAIQQQVQEETFRVKVNLVMLRFTARDSQERLLNSLSQEDFRVIQAGKEREIVFFRSPRKQVADLGKLWIAFLLDVSGSTFATRAEEIMAAQNFLDNIHVFTQIGVFGFTDKLIVFQDFTSRKELAARAFSRARAHQGRTAIYRSVEALIAPLSARAKPGDGKVLIVVSDGMDDGHKRATKTSALAAQRGVEIYTILVPSAALSVPAGKECQQDAEARKKEAAFASLSIGSGGKHFSGIETILDFDSTLAQINDAVFGNLYSLGYYSDSLPGDDQESAPIVKSLRPGVSVSRPFTRIPDRLRAKKRFIEALFYSQVELTAPEKHEESYKQELGADIDILKPRSGMRGKAGLPFRIKISPHTLSRGERGDVRTQLGIIGQLVDANGKEVVRMREFFRAFLKKKDLRSGRGIIYTNKIFAPPGEYSLRIALLEIPTWKMFFFQGPVRVR